MEGCLFLLMHNRGLSYNTGETLSVRERVKEQRIALQSPLWFASKLPNVLASFHLHPKPLG